MEKCLICGSPIPECYALCFVCLADDRKKTIDTLEQKVATLEGEVEKLESQLYNETEDLRVRAEQAETEVVGVATVAKQLKQENTRLLAALNKSILELTTGYRDSMGHYDYGVRPLSVANVIDYCEQAIKGE